VEEHDPTLTLPLPGEGTGNTFDLATAVKQLLPLARGRLGGGLYY